MDILQRALRPADDTTEASVGEETVLLQRKRGAYYGLDPMGTRVWALLKEGHRPLQICAAIAAEFEVEQEQVEEDVRRYLSDLEAHEIVVDR